MHSNEFYKDVASPFLPKNSINESLRNEQYLKRNATEIKEQRGTRSAISFKTFAPFIFSLLILFSVALLYQGTLKSVFIYEDGELALTVETTSRTVDELFTEINIELHPEDKVSLTGNDYLYSNTEIDIEKAFPVFITADQEVKEIWTTGTSVSELLSKGDYQLGDFDEVYPEQEALVGAYEEVKIVRIEKNYTAKESTIPYELVTRENPALARGVTRVVTPGTEGLKKETIEIVLADGEEISRDVVEEEIVEEPSAEIVEKGTKKIAPAPTVSVASLENIEFSRALTVHSTAYCTCTRCTGSGNGITATGAPAIAGNGSSNNPHVIAVDPRVIPLGSTVYIEGYGYAKALDTGGAIKGNKIDLLFATHQQALSFGRRNLNIYLVE